MRGYEEPRGLFWAGALIVGVVAGLALAMKFGGPGLQRPSDMIVGKSYATDAARAAEAK
jgi:hypothetical protein